MISVAMAQSGTHRRLALRLVNLIGGDSSRRIVFGFICACAALSMWGDCIDDATVGVSSDRSKPRQKDCIAIVTGDCLRLQHWRPGYADWHTTQFDFHE